MNTSRSRCFTALERVLDKAIATPISRIEERIVWMHRGCPGADAVKLVEVAGARFRQSAGSSLGVVGASATIPVISTDAVATLTVGQNAASIASAITYVLTVAEIQGVRVIDTERRWVPVLPAPLSKEGSEVVQGQLGLSSIFQAIQLLMQMPLPPMKPVDAHFIERVAKRSAAKGGVLVLGRLLSFGTGITIGWKRSQALANQVIEGAQVALGPQLTLSDYVDGSHVEMTEA